MTIPDELVQAAAEAVLNVLAPVRMGQRIPLFEWGHETTPTDEEMTALSSEVASVALQAAFAKLPECEAVVEIAYQGVATEWGIGRQQTREALQVAFAALAREFGGRE